jgi:hypothetical protein
MNREHLKPFRVKLEAGSLLRGFDSFSGTNRKTPLNEMPA